MKPKVVVIVNDTPNYNGGAAKVAIDSAIGLIAENIKVVFFSAQPLEGEWIYKDIKLINLGQKDILSNPNRFQAATQGIYNKKAREEFGKLLAELDPKTTIIHFHGWTKSLSSSVFHETYKRKFKVVITLHEYFLFCPNGGLYNYVNNEICNVNPMSLKCLLTNCDSRCYKHKLWRFTRKVIQDYIITKNKDITYISISDLNHSIAERYLPKDSQINQLKNPIDLTLEKEDILSEHDKEYYLFVGRISPEKGIDLFCEVMEYLNLSAIVIGDGEDLLFYKQKYTHINFVGWKTQEEMLLYIRKAKALVFTSLWYEGAPLTTKEFRGMGIPLIVSDKCAAKEDVIEGITGYLFKSGDKDSLVQRIKEFETKDWNKFSEASLNTFAREEHELKNHIANLLRIYSELL